MCVFNCINIHELNGQPNNDWGVNISLGVKWDKVVKALRGYKFFSTVAKIGPKLLITSGNDIESIRNSLHYLYNSYDLDRREMRLKLFA